MKLFTMVFATLALSLNAFASIDCASSTIKYRKANDYYGNIIMKNLACAAANQVSFDLSDSSPLVKACEKATVLYKQVGANSTAYCIYLDDKAELIQDYLLVKLVNGAYVPEYQSTRAPTYSNIINALIAQYKLDLLSLQK